MLSLHEAYFLPSKGYVSLIDAVDLFVFFDNVKNVIKRRM